MTKATYKRHMNKWLDKVIAKYGYEHEATIQFARQCDTLKEPTEQNDSILRHCFYCILKYGDDLAQEN